MKVPLFRRQFLGLFACGASLLFSSQSVAQTQTRPVVVIDPGHPSETSAGANVGGLSENLINWQVANLMKPLLEARGMRVILTKTSLNQRVTNRQRAEIANRAGARLFVRLHCDVGGGSGFAWYYPDRIGRKGGVVGPPANVIRESRIAAQTLNETMKPILKPYLRSNPLKTDAQTYVGRKQGGVLTGSIYAKVPTALIEMVFLNNRNDARFIATPNGRKWMATAIARGIEAYVKR